MMAAMAMDLRALTRAARTELDAFTRRHGSCRAELFLAVSHRLSLEYEARTRVSSLSEGESRVAAARVWEGERSGFAALPVEQPVGLANVLEVAWARLGPGGGGAHGPVGHAEREACLPELSAERARGLAEHISRTVVPPGFVVQAEVLTQVAAWSALLGSEGGCQEALSTREEAFVRCETARGAVVDAVASPLGEGWDLEALRRRLAEAVEALEGPAEAVDPGLPLVLRPAVAAPLVAALGWLLRGDVAVATPALARAVGRKPFPSVLSVEDAPLHPLGAQRRSTDDEGLPMRPLRLIEEGRLVGFLHSVATAARLGVEPNGRGLRGELSPPMPSATNLFIVPRGDALPERYTELVARVETFTTMARPGTVSLVAGGWEVQGGRRVRRIAPVDLSLPVLETFRALQAVGGDLTFFPSAEGCGTPTLVFPALLAG